MTFKNLAIGEFFICDREIGGVRVTLMQKTGKNEIRSMQSGANSPVHNDSYIVKPDEPITQINLNKFTIAHSYLITNLSSSFEQ